MAVSILATGDIHIGKRPTRVPSTKLAERASAAHMWENIASQAITREVDAVLLSGDVVDNASRYYEATGPLERGIHAPAKAEIPTYAVAGNHDYNVFPRILDQVDTPLFHVLGQTDGGKKHPSNEMVKHCCALSAGPFRTGTFARTRSMISPPSPIHTSQPLDCCMPMLTLPTAAMHLYA